jgi:hypothetical protein
VGFPDVVSIPEQSGAAVFCVGHAAAERLERCATRRERVQQSHMADRLHLPTDAGQRRPDSAPSERLGVLAKAGDVFRVDGWYDSTHNGFMEKVLAAADKL